MRSLAAPFRPQAVTDERLRCGLPVIALADTVEPLRDDS